MKGNFVPETFQVPVSLEATDYRLEVLRPEVTRLDYDAVMSSKTRLRSVFSEATEWPRDDMTLEKNTDDLARHEREFEAREAFAYTVLSPAGDKCVGCVYVCPPRVVGFDSEVYLWVRDDCVHLDEHLYLTVRNWLVEAWPLKRTAFPGREISWAQWATFLEDPAES
ncbi:MAG: hypothetical protein AAFN78_19110 [Pseudomonadota bacterium]